jgi:hypothetical protein
MRPLYLAGAALLLFQAFGIFLPMQILGAAIDWPQSLDFPAAQVLPLIQAQEGQVRLGYGVYLAWSLTFAASAALIVGLARGDRPLSVLAALAVGLGVASALARAIGIVRWLTGSSALADAYAAAPVGSPERIAIETTQMALNPYGGSVGEDLGVSMFAALWLAVAGAVILKDKGLPAWLGWTAFPVALIAAAPATALVGMASPVDVVIATTGLLLWVAAVAGILAWRGLAPALRRGQD